MMKMEGITPKESSDVQDELKDRHESDAEKKPQYNKILKGSEKPLKSAHGILYVTRKEGKDKPAIIAYREEKLIIINSDNHLIKNLNKMRPIQRNIGLGQLLIRGHFHILEEYVDLPRYEEYVDNMTSILFSKMV